MAATEGVRKSENQIDLYGPAPNTATKAPAKLTIASGGANIGKSAAPKASGTATTAKATSGGVFQVGDSGAPILAPNKAPAKTQAPATNPTSPPTTPSSSPVTSATPATSKTASAESPPVKALKDYLDAVSTYYSSSEVRSLKTNLRSAEKELNNTETKLGAIKYNPLVNKAKKEELEQEINKLNQKIDKLKIELNKNGLPWNEAYATFVRTVRETLSNPSFGSDVFDYAQQATSKLQSELDKALSSYKLSNDISNDINIPNVISGAIDNAMWDVAMVQASTLTRMGNYSALPRMGYNDTLVSWIKSSSQTMIENLMNWIESSSKREKKIENFVGWIKSSPNPKDRLNYLCKDIDRSYQLAPHSKEVRKAISDLVTEAKRQGIITTDEEEAQLRKDLGLGQQ